MNAADQYAARLILPTSQRGPPTAWASHIDHAPIYHPFCLLAVIEGLAGESGGIPDPYVDDRPSSPPAHRLTIESARRLRPSGAWAGSADARGAPL